MLFFPLYHSTDYHAPPPSPPPFTKKRTPDHRLDLQCTLSILTKDLMRVQQKKVRLGRTTSLIHKNSRFWHCLHIREISSIFKPNLRFCLNAVVPKKRDNIGLRYHWLFWVSPSLLSGPRCRTWPVNEQNQQQICLAPAVAETETKRSVIDFIVYATKISLFIQLSQPAFLDKVNQRASLLAWNRSAKSTRQRIQHSVKPR